MTGPARRASVFALARFAALILVASNTVYAGELAPTGTVRAVYLANNPVQARVDPASGATIGPAADLARALAKEDGSALSFAGLPGVAAVIEAVKTGDADIGFLAHDPVRAAEVDFTQAYSLAHNTYLVLKAPRRPVDALDRPGMIIGVGQGDAADLYLKRTLTQATLRPNPGGSLEAALAQLQAGEIDAYAANRQRLTAFAARTPEVRVLDENFLAVRQAIIVAKGNPARLALLNRFIDAARRSGLIEQSIANAKLNGVEAAPPP